MTGLVLVALGGLAAVAAAATDAGVPIPSFDPSSPPATPLLGPLSAKPGGTSRTLEDYRLRRADDGTHDLVYETEGFTARVARDGSVKFRDRHAALAVLPILFGSWGHAPKPAVPSVQEMFRRLKGPQPPPRDQEIEDATTRYGSRLPIPEVTPYRPDPREACQYPSPCFWHARTVLVSANLNFDLTDELMRMSGQDPYRFAKARFLAGTREMRAELGARAHAEDLRRSMLDLPKRVQTIACDPTRSVAERRALLTALRAELDAATPEGRAAAAVIDRRLTDQSEGHLACP
jgi:hypothetical protein